jgi:linoleoyl-CoA desaturase
MWRTLHHHGHHSCINVYGEDEAILGRNFFRFSPHSQRRSIYRYQHIYVFPLYFLFSLDYVLIKDIQCFFFPNYQPLKHARHAAREYLILFGGKLFYLMYMLTIPIAVLGRPSLLVLSAFAVTHGIIGMTTLMVFQSTHVIEASHFPQTRNDFDTYVEHIFATTADYSTRNRLASFLVGGLNHHIVHHLLPNVCHTHYDELTKIVRETSREHGIVYREHETIWKAFARHLALLKRLGRA